jgi:hypothetical protein
MKIELMIDGEQRVFIAPRPLGIRVREAISLRDKTRDQPDMTAEDLDDVVQFAVEVFDNQFTIDELYKGIYADELLTELMRVIVRITEKTEEKLETKNG